MHVKLTSQKVQPLYLFAWKGVPNVRTKCYSSTTLYYKVLLQYYSVLQSATPVLVFTTKYYSSTTLYYTVLLQYYSVLQSTTPVLIQCYSVLHRSTPVQLCTTKYYSSTTLYYKVLLRYYSLYYKVRSWKARSTNVTNVSKCCACHAKWLSWLILVTYETSFTMRRVTGLILQRLQILNLPRKLTLMSDVRHIWNVIYNARSNRCHPPMSPSTVPATKNDSHHWSSWHMKRHWQCAEQQASPSNLTKCCACHEKWLASLILGTYETSFTMRGATGIRLQRHQILRLPRKVALQNQRKICRKQLKRQFQCATDPSMIRAWTRHLAPSRSPRLLFALRRRILYWKLQHFALRLSTQISPNTVPATKSDTPTSPSAAPATKSDTPRSPNTVPATKSDAPTSPNTAPATQNDSHDWCPSHMKRHLQCAEQQVSSSNVTKYCTCHEKWHAWLILVTYEMSFTMRGATGITLQPHQILRLPRKVALQNQRKICRKQLKRQFQCATDPSMIRAWSEHELVISHPPVRRGYFSRFGDAFCIENYNISRSGYLPKFHQILCLPRKVTLQHHQVLRLPRKVTLQDHQILRLPRKVALQDHQILRLPSVTFTALLLYCSFYCTVTLLLFLLHSYFTVTFTALLAYCYIYCTVTLLLLLLHCYFTVTFTALLLYCSFYCTVTLLLLLLHCYFTVTFTALLLYFCTVTLLLLLLHCYFTVTLLLHCYFTVTFTALLLYCYFYCTVTLLLLLLHSYFTVTFTALLLYCYFYCTVTLLLLLLHGYFTVTFTARLLYCYFYCTVTLLLLLLHCYFITALLLYCYFYFTVTLLLLLLHCYFTVTFIALLLYCYFYCTVTLLLLTVPFTALLLYCYFYCTVTLLLFLLDLNCYFILCIFKSP